MKANFKRLFALLLTLCLLASLMVPAAFAEDVAVEAPAASVTEAETYPIRLVDMTNPDTATGYSKWFKGSSGWKDNLAMTKVVTNLDTEYEAGNLDWRYIGTNDSKYYYYANVMMQPRLTDKDTWAALQIRVSEDGRYALNLHTDKTKDSETEVSAWTNTVSEWKGNVTAYIFPLADLNAAIAGGMETNAAVESLMNEANCVGTQTLAADETDVTFNKVRMDAGEYVVVYSASALYYCISEMTLLEDAADAAMYEYEQVVRYPVRFADPTVASADATGLAINLRNNSGYTTKGIASISTAISDAYGTLNWKYLAEASTAKAQYRANTALQLRSDANGLVALQINVPQAGYYALTVGVDRSTDYTYVTQGFATTPFDVSAYLLKASADVTVTADNIATLAADENSVGVASLAGDATSAMFERTYMEAGSYVLIYSLSTQANISEFGLAQRKIDMPLTGEGATVTQHIELNAFESGDSTLAAAAAADGTYADISEYVNTAYAAGSMDWKIENYADAFTDGNFNFVAGKGLKAATPATSAGDWFALRIRVKNSGNYSINLKSAGVSDQFVAYMFPATSDAMTPEEIAANMSDANGIYYNGYQVGQLDAKISAGYLEGEYILVFQSIHDTKPRQVYLDDIILESESFTAEDVQFYNLNLFDETNTAYYDLVSNRYTATTADGVTTYEKMALVNGSFAQANYVLTKDAEGNPTELGELYKVVLQKQGLGYPKTLNWRPDAGHIGEEDKDSTDMEIYRFVAGKDPAQSTVFYFNFANAATEYKQYASLMLHVDKAGTYNLSLATGKAAGTAKIYFVDSFAANAANATRMPLVADTTIQSIMANGTGLLGEGYTTLPAFATVDMGQVTVDAAGDFLILFEADPTSNAMISLTDITLTPVIEDAGAARISNVNYATFEEAVAAAEIGDTITLMDNVVTTDVDVKMGVTLNLNGYALNAQNVTAIGAKIIDSGDGIGKLRVNGNLKLSENNGQLPLYNGLGDYYCFYNVDVQAVATTGSGNDTKYWFKVDFSNDAALALIGADTELRIQVLMEGVYSDKLENAGDAFAATASADAAFSYMWAANSDSYITVSTVGSNGIDNFVLNPAVTANGVTISGDAMTRNA